MKRYALKPGITMDEIFDFVNSSNGKYHIAKGDSWISKDSEYFMTIYLYDDISLNIAFPKDLEKWDDFDHVEVLDEECVQPYTPFYSYMSGEISEPYEYLQRVVEAYLSVMDSFPFLQAIS